MQLDEIVPWGRSYDDYRAMFALTETDLARRILGVGDGPASFNAEAHARGQDVTSIDPLYAFTRAQIAHRIQAARPLIEAGVRADAPRLDWRRYRDVETLIATRLAAMDRFLADYPESGAGPGGSTRYRPGALPRLPCPDRAFDLTLVSHLLFNYSEHLGLAGHRAAVAELLRVSTEVRLFPLLTLDGTPSPHLAAVRADAEAAGWRTTIEPVDYVFQVGGDRMLRLTRPPGP